MLNVKLSSRDLKILTDLHLNGFLSFYQIHNEYFNKRAKTTVYNRLSKLIRAGFIDTLQVNLKQGLDSDLDIGVIYKLTKKGLSIVTNRLESDHIRKDLIPINLNSLYHDLILTDVLRLFKKKDNVQKVINTKALKVTSRYGVQQPDAILFDHYSGQKIALELELTAKSESRYRDIITNYQTSSEYEKVIYITLNNAITKKIGGIVTGFGSSYELDDHSAQFDFMNVKDVLNFNFNKGGYSEL